ncbi:hypothetical protein FO488_09910 [Geobacter sp. FeAm09]|uniref:hypothetical protein n=1 Tax=Geobacter sp. FeAm09 TaxID=2597769 RepID=UPI0011EF8D12|nr:hypothetical protein [Geobacter sp. FeAm09]QEM68451.1 hypothetical protein FO488_09910 [Geobacter sp. FeAm09]
MLERRRPSAGTICVLASLVLLFSAGAQAEENVCGPTTPSEERLFNLQLENEGLKLKIKQLEAVKTISAERLRQKKVQRLREIAAQVKVQRQTTSDFQGFVTWMSTNLAGYNRYIQAGSYAAVAARMLPIPYAGQASIFTKFIAQFTVALNNASVSVTNYLNSSQRFIAQVEAMDPAKPLDDKAITETSLFADQKLLKDMNDAQAKLATVADLSSGALSFLESVNHYASGTDEYWNKVKGLVKKDIDPKEKSFLSESTSNLKTQANRFNGKLRSFEDITTKQAASVKSLAVYDELAADLVAAK